MSQESLKEVILYVLTDSNWETHGPTKRGPNCPTKWGPNVTHETSGEGELCGPGWVHAYTDPLLAVLLDPIHAGYINGTLLWEARGIIRKDDHGLRVGCTKLTTVKQISLPKFSPEQCACFAILCTKAVYKGSGWNAWADDWLSGRDRTTGMAHAVSDAVFAEYLSADATAARIALKAKRVADPVVYAMAYLGYAAFTAFEATEAARCAAADAPSAKAYAETGAVEYAAADAADAATKAAEYAAYAAMNKNNKNLDFVAFAKKAHEFVP